jgi:hypothetical protein
LYTFLLQTKSFAVTPTATATSAPTDPEKEQNLLDQINNLKEKVASKVAELKLVEKRGIVVLVNQTSGNKITTTDLADQTRFVDVDEITKFASPSAKGTFGISDITKGMRLSVIGLYNKQSKRILARDIEVVTLPMFVSGTVKDIDKVNFTVTIVSQNQTSIIVDIENVTKTSVYTDEDGVARGGFSKIVAGERVYVSGYPSISEKNRMTATRIIAFPELAKDSKVIVAQPTAEEISPTPTKKVVR